MRALTFLPPRRVDWREVPEPTLQGPGEALVRPVIASRCDGDNLPLFNNVTTGLRAGVALHFFDPLVTDVLGSQPFGRPFAIGHECIAEVIECGEAVTRVRPRDLVIVPWSVSCGSCANCSSQLTSRCTNAGGTLLSGYGFGAALGEWGGMVSDLIRVPYADAMLVHVPPNVDPMKLASASDNMPDAWRAVGPQLAKSPQGPVLVVGGGARSIALYAVGMAVALGSSRVDYVDFDPERLAIAESLGARPIEARRGSGWFSRHAPRVHGEFQIAVEASSTVAGLRYALRSLATGGVCTAVGYYFQKNSGLPLMQMYVNSTSLHVGVSHPRAALPQVVELIARGTFDSRKVTTLTADWNDAPDAFA